MSAPHDEIRKQVRRGLAYVRSIQAPDGSLTGSSLFANATALQFLAAIKTPTSRAIQRRLCGWLLTHKQADGSFGTSLHITCCILHALHAVDKTLVTSDMIGSLARQLVAAEYSVGGPYRGQPEERQPDIGTNALIGSLLERLEAPLPAVNEYVDTARAQGLQSAFYAADGLVPGSSDSRPIDTILASQKADGSWPARPYCREADGTWHVSAALTTVRNLAALTAQSSRPPRRRTTATVANSNYQQVVRIIEREIRSFKEPLRSTGNRMLQTILAADMQHEIALLPFMFADDMRDRRAHIPRQQLLSLGVGNIYNWMAYTIYDDFLDGSGDPRLLSIANVSLRLAVSHFQAGAPDAPTFQRFIAHTFMGIDTANAWEVTYCHMPYTDERITLRELPAYGDGAKLAERSYSHALPALGVLANCGIDPHAPAALAIRKAFKHYLIARQLSDDMRDWEEDIRAGQISPVVSAIITALSIGQGSHAFEALLPAMKRQFWQDTLEHQCREILRHVRLSRQAIGRSQLLQEDNMLSRILDELELVVARTHDEQRNMRAFLQGYGTSQPSG